MSKFVLTAQLKLQAPKNTQQVVNQIKGQLSGVSVDVNVKGATQAQRQIKQITAATNQATSAAHNMGKTFGVALKRFAAFTIASRAVSLFTNGLANAVQESIDFQREIVKIAQVTGKTTKELRGLSDEISRLATTLGTSSKDLVSVSRILAQAGIQAGDLKVALEALAKTTLAPTFEDIHKTAEGAVAILSQFGGGVGDLERQLGAINAVAGQFAVESGDLIGAVRRFGGVFKAAGGDLNEFLGLFTSVRATTRESAESIATGLRTIFTRIQRPSTIQYLEEMGVKLTDARGRFVGAWEAVRRLSIALKDMPAGDLKFIEIAEELGGFRQIGKVIPLLQQFEKAEKARQAAIAGGDSLTKDAATAQQSLAVQIMKVRQEFEALVRGVTESTSFQVMTKTALSLASALIRIADALKPIIPLLGAFAAIKVSQGIGGFAAGIGASLRGVKAKHEGGKIHHFARGGSVPGTGNRDTVPAMLQPGEFVIRKSSVNKIGTDQLQAMNNNKFVKGGIISLRPFHKKGQESEPLRDNGQILIRDVARRVGMKGTIPALKQNFQKMSALGVSPEFAKLSNTGKLSANAVGVTMGSRVAGEGTETEVKAGFKRTINNAGKALSEFFGAKLGKKLVYKDLELFGINSVIGNAFEALLVRLGAPFDAGNKDNRKKAIDKANNNSAFDFPTGLHGLAKGRFAELKGIPVDAKRTLTASNLKKVITTKWPNLLAEEANGLKSILAAQPLSKDAIRSVFTKKGGGLRTNMTLPAIQEGMKAQGLGGTSGRGIKMGDLQAAGVVVGSGGKYNIDPNNFASGGSVGKDTVPAMLTPGEFVVNKKSARSIGYANLNRMNKKGVTGFATGGPVGVQKFAAGGAVGGFSGMEKLMIALPLVTSVMSEFGDKSKDATDSQFRAAVASERLTAAFTQILVYTQLIKAGTAWVQKFGKGLEKAEKAQDKKTIKDTKALAQVEKGKVPGDPGAPGGLNRAATVGGGELDKNMKRKREEAATEETEKKSKKKKKKKKKNAMDMSLLSDKKAIDAKREEGEAADTKKSIDEEKTRSSKANNVEELAQEQAVQKRQDDLDTKKGIVVAERAEHERLENKRFEQEGLNAYFPGGEKRTLEKEAKDAAEAVTTTGKAADMASRQSQTEQWNQGEAERKAATDREKAAEATSAAEMFRGAHAEAKQREQNAEMQLTQAQNAKMVTVESSSILGPDGKPTQTKMMDRGGGEFQSISDFDKEVAGLQDNLTDASATTQTLSEWQANATKAEKEAIETADKSAKVAETQSERTQAAMDNEATARTAASDAMDRSKEANKKLTTSNESLAQTHTDLSASSTRLAQNEKDVNVATYKLANAKAKESKVYHPAVQHANKMSRALQQELKEKRRALKGTKWYNSGLKRLSIRFTQGKQALNVFRKQLKILPRDATKAKNALAQLNAQMKKSGGGKKGGVKGAIGGFLSKMAGPIGAIAGVITTAMVAGQQFAAAMGEIAQRSKERAVDRGDMGEALKSGKAGQMAEQMGELFTVGGLLQAFFDKNFHKNRKSKAELQDVDTAISVDEINQKKIMKDVEEGKFRGVGDKMDLDRFSKATFESADKAALMKEMGEADEGKQKEQLKERAIKIEEAQITAMANSGVSVNEFTKHIKGMAGKTVQAEDKLISLGVALIKAKEAQEAVTKANFDNLKVMSVFAASSNAVNGFLSSLETGSLSLESTIATIEAAQSNVGLGDEGKQALKEARQQVLKAVGGDKDSAVGKAVGRSFDRAVGVNDFMSTLQDRVSNVDLNAANESVAQEQLIAALTKGVADKDIRTTVEAKVRQMSKDGGLRGKDLSKVVADIKAGLEPLSKTAMGASRALLQHQQTILKLTQQRRKAELDYIAAQRKAVDIQLEAAKIFESFGGDKLTSEQKEQARTAQFNVTAKDAGIGPLRNAGVGELARARQEVSDQMDAQMATRVTGGFQEAGGVDANRIKELKSTNKALMDLTKQRVTQIKEEIAIIAKKNAAEKSSLDKLMSGDIEGFMDQQAAAGAAAALRSGNANMAGMFGPQALGAALKDMQGTGMSDAQMQRSAGIALSNMGITDARSAGIMAGVDPDTAALRAEGRGLAGELGAQAEQMATMEMMEVAAKQVVIDRSEIIFGDNMLAKVRGQQRAEEGRDAAVDELAGAKSKGGLIYASRGIFVPRGTDTVPAMLTPGEFVVNRGAVNRGNNLQILRAMNGSGRESSGGPEAAGMQSGGQVGYYKFGDLVRASTAFSDSMPALSAAVSSFSSAIDKLTGFNMGIDINSIPPISVNVILPQLEPAISDIVLDAVAKEIPQYKATAHGLKKNPGMNA